MVSPHFSIGWTKVCGPLITPWLSFDALRVMMGFLLYNLQWWISGSTSFGTPFSWITKEARDNPHRMMAFSPYVDWLCKEWWGRLIWFGILKVGRILFSVWDSLSHTKMECMGPSYRRRMRRPISLGHGFGSKGLQGVVIVFLVGNRPYSLWGDELQKEESVVGGKLVAKG